MSSWHEEEAELGYLHYFYEVEKYFGECIVGKGVDTKSWTFKGYAENFVEYDIVRFEVNIAHDDSEPFVDGMRSAHKDFLEAIHAYRLEQSAEWASPYTLSVSW